MLRRNRRSDPHDSRRQRFRICKNALRDRPDEAPPPFDHDGIEDGPIQKAGRVIYHSDDDWVEF